MLWREGKGRRGLGREGKGTGGESDSDAQLEQGRRLAKAGPGSEVVKDGEGWNIGVENWKNIFPSTD